MDLVSASCMVCPGKCELHAAVNDIRTRSRQAAEFDSYLVDLWFLPPDFIEEAVATKHYLAGVFCYVTGTRFFYASSSQSEVIYGVHTL